MSPAVGGDIADAAVIFGETFCLGARANVGKVLWLISSSGILNRQARIDGLHRGKQGTFTY